MAAKPRVIIIVLDSVGIGALPDAADYGDAGTNTLAHLAEAVGGLNLPNLARMGLGNIAQIRGVGNVTSPEACWGKMAEMSKGKDTTTGTDHTREYVPILAWGPNCRTGADLGVRESFSDLASTAAAVLGICYTFPGTSFDNLLLDTGPRFHI